MKKTIIFKSNTINGALDAIIGELERKELEYRALGVDGRHVVITPDSYTLSIEKLIPELAAKAFRYGALNVEVVSFSRLAHKELKNKNVNCLSKEGAVLILGKVIKRNIDRLTYYNRVARLAGFAREMFAVIASLRNNSVTVADLNKALSPSIAASDAYGGREVRPMREGTTKNKTADIALLYEEYLKELETHFYDSTSRIDKFIEGIAHSPVIAATDFYILGFDTFSGKQTEVITALSNSAKSLNIGLITPLVGHNATLYPRLAYKKLKAALYPMLGDRKLTAVMYPKANDKKLKALAYNLTDGRKRESKLYPTANYKKLKATLLNVEERNAYETNIAEPFGTLHRELFSGLENVKKNVNGAVTLFKEDNIFEEFNAVAHQISWLVNHKNYRYKDIAVIDCNPEHKQELRDVFRRYNIPNFIDIRYPMSGTLPYKYIVAILDAARFNYRQDKVRVLIKNPLFGMDEREVFLFENYILAHNISYSAFETPFTAESNVRFEPIRRRLISLTAPFRTSTAKVSYYADAVAALLNDEAFGDRLDRAMDFASDGDSGFTSAAGVDANADTGIKKSNSAAVERISEDILEEYKALVGDEIVCLSEFEDMLATSAAVEEIAFIPHYVDSVYVGKLRESFIYRPKAIFVIGATADVLPSPHGYKAIMSEEDFAQMAAANIRLYPTPEDHVKEEQFAVIDLITKAREKLYLGYAVVEPSGAINKPSPIITGAKDLLIEEKPISDEEAKKYRQDDTETIKERDERGAIAERTYVRLQAESLERRFDIDSVRVRSAACAEADGDGGAVGNGIRYEGDITLADSVVTPENAYFKFRMIRASKLPTDRIKYVAGNANEDSDAVGGALDEKEKAALRMRNSVYASLDDKYKSELAPKEDRGPVDVPLFDCMKRNKSDNDVVYSAVSQIEDFYSCPYRHYLNYGLRLKERETGTIALIDIGNIVHAVLEKFIKEVAIGEGKDIHRLASENPEALRETARKIIYAVLNGDNNDKINYMEQFGDSEQSAHTLSLIEKRLAEDVKHVTEKILQGNFTPLEAEMTFGFGKDGEPAWVVEDDSFGKVYLRGKIDRVDIVKNNLPDGMPQSNSMGKLAIIDYKTGAVNPSLSEVYFGTKLQLYVYLAVAMRKYKDITPAGAFYIPVKDGYTQAGSDYSYKGSVLADLETVRAFDKDIAEREPYRNTICSVVVPASIAIDKSGGISLKSTTQVLSADQYAQTMDYMQKMLVQALRCIKDGYIERRPFKGACERCGVASICGGAYKAVERACSAKTRPFEKDSDGAIATAEEEDGNEG